jgi:hypothetical protein
MLPLHQGKSTIALYSQSKMEQVSICLDSGKLATDSCYQDVRTADGLSRVEKVWVYPEDKPIGYCDKHITLEYCPDGHGVANEYCKKFAQVGAVKLEPKALVKLTKSRIETLLRASGKGLNAMYLRDDYVFLVDKKGTAQPFFGFRGTINEGL